MAIVILAALLAQGIEERVPRGETVENRSGMVTAQRFRGGVQIGAHRLLDRVVTGFVGARAGTRASPTVDGEEDGHRFATTRIDCPTNPATGRPRRG